MGGVGVVDTQQQQQHAAAEAKQPQKAVYSGSKDSSPPEIQKYAVSKGSQKRYGHFPTRPREALRLLGLSYRKNRLLQYHQRVAGFTK